MVDQETNQNFMLHARDRPSYAKALMSGISGTLEEIPTSVDTMQEPKCHSPLSIGKAKSSCK